MPIILYDLAGRDTALRFSPRCWRTRFALAHKELAVETIPWRSEAANLPQPNQGRVPEICDGTKVVCDSWKIAEYLEDAYPDRPSLFAGSGGHAHARFVNEWTETLLLPSILPMILVDLFASVDPGYRSYFRTNWEARLGMTLEAAQADREHRLPSFNAMLTRYAQRCPINLGWAAFNRVTLTTWLPQRSCGQAVLAILASWV